MSVSSWTGLDADRSPATWAFIDGSGVGGSGGNAHDGPDMASMAVIEFVDRDVSAKGQDSGPVQKKDEGEAAQA